MIKISARENIRMRLKEYDITYKPLPENCEMWTKERLLEQTEWYEKRDKMVKLLDLHNI
jgi:hypothetical protein